MIDLHKQDRSRQNSVWVNGIEYPIHTEFFYWIGFNKKFEDMYQEGKKEFSLDDLDYLYVCEVPEDKKAGYEELYKFYEFKQPLPNPSKTKTTARGLDWLIDSEYIFAAFLEKYGINLIEQNLHWHDFLSLFNALGGTKINEIMQARYSKKEGKYDPYKESREAWKLPEVAIKKEPFKMR